MEVEKVFFLCIERPRLSIEPCGTMGKGRSPWNTPGASTLQFESPKLQPKQAWTPVSSNWVVSWNFRKFIVNSAWKIWIFQVGTIDIHILGGGGFWWGFQTSSFHDLSQVALFPLTADGKLLPRSDLQLAEPGAIFFGASRERGLFVEYFCCALMVLWYFKFCTNQFTYVSTYIHTCIYLIFKDMGIHVCLKISGITKVFTVILEPLFSFHTSVIWILRELHKDQNGHTWQWAKQKCYSIWVANGFSPWNH